MTDAFVTVGGGRVRRMSLNVPNIGVWTANVEFLEGPALADGAAVDLRIGASVWRGIVAPGENGVFALTRRCMVRGGAGLWGRTLPAKHYHNDFGVRAREVVADLCRETGETLGSFLPASERLGVDYVRQAEMTAAGTLADAIGGVPWWVGQDGQTNVGVRPATTLNASAYELLAYDPRLRMATLGVNNDIRPIQIGATIVDPRLDRPAVIRGYTVVVDADKLRVHAYCGGDEATPGNLAGLLTSIVRRIMDERLVGRFKYRVIGMRSDGRVDVQAVNRIAGVPDLQYISMWPGVAGVHAELTPGAEVLIEFIDGDRAQPIITGFVGKQGPGFVPVKLVLGGTSGPAAARVGDTVSSGGFGTYATFMPPVTPPPPGPPPPMVCGTAYWVSFDQTPPTQTTAAGLDGKITSGSSIVDIAPDVVPLP